MPTNDIEKGADGTVERPNTPSSCGKMSVCSGQTADKETELAPIRLAGSAATVTAKRSQSLCLERSNNGYGCDGLDEMPDDSASGAPGHPNQEKDPFEVTFEGGDDDVWCPRTFSIIKKWVIVVITSFGSFCVTCASSMYTSTYEQMDAEFGNSRIVATLGLSLFVLGIALAAPWSPLSESYGRRPIYIAAFFAFAVFIIPCAIARNIETVIITRFFQGLSGSAFLSVAGGTVGDLFSPNHSYPPMTLFTMAPFLGPSVGPLIGGFVNTYLNWRWTHYILIIWAFCLWVGIIVFVPETYHPVVLRNKARQKRKCTGDDRWKAPIEKTSKSVLRTMGFSLLRPIEILLFEPIALLLDLYSAILLGVMYLFFGAFPLVFENNYGFNLWQTGLTFLGIFVGMLMGAFTGKVWMGFRDKLIAKNELIEPEFRLPSVMAGSVLVSAGIFWFGWTSIPSIHFMVPIIGTAIFGAGSMLVFNGIFTFLVDAYPKYAASALSANALVRCSFAAAFPLFGIQMYDKLGYQWATSLLGFLTAAMLPFPVLFFKFGKRIRSKSKMATSG